MKYKYIALALLVQNFISADFKNKNTIKSKTLTEDIYKGLVDPEGVLYFKNYLNLFNKSLEKTDINLYTDSRLKIKKIAIYSDTIINDYLFEYIPNLKEVIIPNVTKIGKFAFSNCTRLTTINLPKLTDIGEYAFYNCTRLTTIFT
jgi:hypothetical protein